MVSVVWRLWLCMVYGFDDVKFVGDVHGLAFLWVEVHAPV